MKKLSIIFLAILFIASVSVWFSCNPFLNKKTAETYDVLDQIDHVKATQPDIYIPAALVTVRDNLKADNRTYPIVDITSNPNNDANYKVTDTNGAPKLVTGDFKTSRFEVYATETSVELFKNTIYVYYYTGLYPDGPVLYEGLYKYLQNKNGVAPKMEDPFIKMHTITMYKAVNNADGSRLIQIYTDSSYWTIYRKAGNPTVYVVQGKLDTIP